jgi:hypothetical protein
MYRIKPKTEYTLLINGSKILKSDDFDDILSAMDKRIKNNKYLEVSNFDCVQNKTEGMVFNMSELKVNNQMVLETGQKIGE